MAINNYKHNLEEPLVVKDLQITGTRVDNQNTLVFTKSIQLSADNTSGGGLILSDDGDFVDLNTGFGAFRFANGIQVYSGQRSGSSIIQLGSSGDITLQSSTSNIIFSDSGNTNIRGIIGVSGNSDFWFFGGGATASNAGFAQISTGDDGNEPIYVRQYTGDPRSGTLQRTLTLLNESGNTIIPAAIGIGTTNPQSQLHITGQFQSTQANSTTTGGGQIYLNGSVGNRIDFNTSGGAAPSFTTRSAGTKIVLYPLVGASSVDYAFGIEPATLWSSISDSSNQFKWYAGTTNIATLKGTGELLLGTTSATGTASQRLQVDGGAYINGNIGIGTTNPFGSNIYNGLDVNRASAQIHARNIGTTTDAGVYASDQDYFSTPSFSATIIRKLGTGFAGNIFSSIPHANLGTLAFQNTANGLIYTNGGAPLIFATFSTEAMRIDSSQRLGIGTNSPTSKLHVVGDSLVTGVTTIRGNLNAAGNYYVKLARTTNQTVTNGIDTLIAFTATSDTNGWYSGITTRTIPTVAGTYRVDVMLNWQAGSITNNQTNIQLRKNGTTFALHQVGIATFSYSQTACGIVTMNGTSDYIDFTAFTGNTTNQGVTGTADGAWTKMEIFKIN
jgi:hypothetical protein